ncbi:SET domain protein [Roridomyces roridus]|uniref:SET domain protein n=1 Tax=Roridomyces roridus TaxID=1738132 RepID=A0AAD7C4Z9_9AGAR|nr:SET domain protein [Roridomyces roridus]
MSTTVLSPLKTWLERYGGYIHPQIQFSQVDAGFSVVASQDLPPDSKIASCPFQLVVTKDSALVALRTMLGDATPLQSWSPRQLISSYLCFHWIIADNSSLKHGPYVDSLPSRDKLRTPLHFTPKELELFKGSNLYGATLDRERDWRVEYEQCHAAIANVNEEWGNQFTWELFLTAATHLSSRAFPSTLMSETPSLTSPTDSEPILLPGVDSLNHARGAPVSWVSSYGPITSPESTISLVLHNAIAAGEEAFNNYGAKPNSELILGYGFSLPDNPDDTIVLKLGGVEGKKWEVGRDAREAEQVWDGVLAMMLGSPDAEPTYEDYLDAAAALTEMVETLLDKLPHASAVEVDAGIREDVVGMFSAYVKGQREILESLVVFARSKEEVGISMAREEGIEVVLD